MVKFRKGVADVERSPVSGGIIRGQIAAGHNRSNKQKQLRARLITAGLDLFLRNGFDATTVAEIADAAEISRRSFFRYFPSKDDLVFDWLLEQGNFISRRLADRAHRESPLPAIRAAMIERARLHDSDRAPAILLTRIAFDTPSLSGRFAAEVARWEDTLIAIMRSERQLTGMEEFTLRIQISASAAAFLGAMRAWAHGNYSGSLQAWVEAAFKALELKSSGLRKRRTHINPQRRT